MWQGEKGYTVMSGYQNIVINYLSPHTINTRLLLKWNPGMGKTFPAVRLSKLYIDIFDMQNKYGSQRTGKVFVFGFHSEIFKREVMHDPDSGMFTRAQIEQLDELHLKTMKSNDTQTVLNFKLKEDEFKKRIKQNVKFYGYKKIVNDMFRRKTLSAEENSKIIDMVSNMSEEELSVAIKKGDIDINEEFIMQFDNSLIICDEIHNVYNSSEKNNWGITLQLILDRFPTVKVILLSATPVYGSPTEVVDIMNLLSTTERYKKSDFFDMKTKKIIPGVEDKIYRALYGKVSFVVDANIDEFAEEKWVGEPIPGIQLFNFIRCPMSKLHQQVYDQSYKGSLSTDELYLNDFIIPYIKQNINRSTSSRDAKDEKIVGIYKTSEIKKYLSSISEDTFRKIGLRMNQQDGIIYGFGLQKEKLANISTKYYNMLTEIDKYMKPVVWSTAPNEYKSGGKIFIYHNTVIMSGVSFIKNVLLENGFISYGQFPTSATRCSICGLLKSDPIHTTSHSPAEVKLDTFTESTVQMIKDFYEFKKVSAHAHGIVSSRYAVEIVGDKYYNPAFIDIKDGELLFAKIPTNAKIYISKIGNYRSILKDILSKYKYKKIADDNYNTIYMRPVTNTGSSSLPAKHIYYPATFITILRDASVDSDSMNIEKSLQIFNSPANIDGKLCKIIVSSKIMVAGRNITEANAVFIMSVPKNISELIQIIYRGRRKGSHKKLPPEKRLIEYHLFVSSLGDSKLDSDRKIDGNLERSHEEENYRKKIDIYEDIQYIDTLFNKAAFDIQFNRKFVEKVLSKDTHTVKPKWFSMPEIIPRDITETTFDIYEMDNQVIHIMYIIKRIFIEYFPVLTFDELHAKVLSSPYLTINKSFVDEETFAMALSLLLVENLVNTDVKSDEKIDVITGVENNTELIPFDYLVAKKDKRLIWPDSNKIGYIVEQNGYYIAGIYDKHRNKIILSKDILLRTYERRTTKNINLNKVVQTFNINDNYEAYKFNYQRLTQNIDNQYKFNQIANTFNITFHERFVEELIRFMYHLLCTPECILVSDNLKFYIYMYKYYKSHNVLVTANQIIAVPNMYDLYTTKPIAQDNYIDLYIKESFEKKYAIKTSSAKDDNKIVNDTVTLKIPDEKTKIIKTPSNILPVGYMYNKLSRLYFPGKWVFDIGIIHLVNTNIVYQENPVIVGYYHPIPKNMGYIFKIRKPISTNSNTDRRKFEKGIECYNLDKSKILDVFRKLKLTEPESSNKYTYCKILENKLLELEMKSRLSGSDVKYVYYTWESRPEEKNKLNKSQLYSSGSESKSFSQSF
jgi:hypothetical protein